MGQRIIGNEIRNKPRKYKQEDKIQIMYSFATTFESSWSAASAALGVPITTLKHWTEDANLMVEVEAYKEMMQSRRNMTVNLADMVDAQILTKQASFLDDAFKVKEEALKRAYALLNETSSLKDVTGLIQLLHNITENDLATDKQNDKSDIYQQILNFHQHGNTYIQGDSTK